LQQGSSLSHLQLLARSIGIPSAILSERAWRSLAPLDGEEVVLDVRGDRSVLIALVDRDMPAPLTTDSVSSSRVLTLPEVDTKTTDILPLNKVTLEIRPPVAGRKASTLGTLRESELKSVVPDGVVIPFGIYEELLSRSGADGTIDDLASRLQSGGSSVDCEKQLQRIRQKLIGTSFSSRRRSEIAGALERAFKSAGVFVRSDSNIEDLPQFTGAGLNLTLPNVKGRSEVLDAIKKVWSSLWSDRGFAWRRDRIRDQRSVKGSILIMRAIDARKAGVMMTRDLEDGGDRKIFISAHEGLGIKVVEGSETPEELVVDLETGAVEYRRFSKAKVKIVLDPKGGVMSVPRRPFGKILTLDEIRDLTLVAASLQQTLSRYGSTQWNVEWLFDEESKLRVLQARPYSN